MLLVKTFLKNSSIHGIGLFVGENIRKGTVVWEFNPVVDKKIGGLDFNSLPEIARAAIAHYSYLNGRGEYVLCGDDARFFNHSERPNCIDRADGAKEVSTIAARGIKKGEELTCNYLSFDYSVEPEKLARKSPTKGVK